MSTHIDKRNFREYVRKSSNTSVAILFVKVLKAIYVDHRFYMYIFVIQSYYINIPFCLVKFIVLISSPIQEDREGIKDRIFKNSLLLVEVF